MSYGYPFPHVRRRQRGAAAVEFSVVALVFFAMFFGVIEFARFMYVNESVQEVTRRAAREAVVRWLDQHDTVVKGLALLGGSSYPAAPEVTTDSISFTYFNPNGGEVLPSQRPPDAATNITECQKSPPDNAACISSVRVSVSGVTYLPLLPFFGELLNIEVPSSTVAMPAESLGYQPN